MTTIRAISRITLAIALAASGTANATQVIPQVQYTNDNIEQGGIIRACVATAAMINPPAPEMVNLQFLAIFGRGQAHFRGLLFQFAAIRCA